MKSWEKRAFRDQLEPDRELSHPACCLSAPFGTSEGVPRLVKPEEIISIFDKKKKKKKLTILYVH